MTTSSVNLNGPAHGNSTPNVDGGQTASLLSQEYSGEANMMELFDTLNASESIAKAVEARLDGVLGNLDALLANLEKAAPVHEQSNQHTVECHTDGGTEGKK